MTNVVRMGIVDNDRFALSALATVLNRELNADKITLLWTACSGTEALQLCSQSKTRPDILLVDISMEDVSGVRVCRTLRYDNPSIKLLAMTSFTLETYVRQVAAAGAQGIVAKNNPQEIAQAIRTVSSGKCWIPKIENTAGNSDMYQFTTAGEAYQQAHKNPTHELSARETQIVDRCAKGQTYAEIATALEISEATVRTYIERARTKLGASNRLELVAMWLDERRWE